MQLFWHPLPSIRQLCQIARNWKFTVSPENSKDQRILRWFSMKNMAELEMSKIRWELWVRIYSKCVKTFPSNFREDSRNFPGHFPNVHDISRKNSGTLSENSRKFLPEHCPAGKCSENYRKTSGKNPEHFRKISGKFPQSFRHLFQKNSRPINFPGIRN